MKKEELLGIFRTSINNCKLVYASIIIFIHDDMPSFYSQWSASLKIPRPFQDEEIIALISNEEILKIAFSELYETVHRAAIKELFEVTKYYCKESNQINTLKAQSWYQFWRILRNCFSHTFRFHFNSYDKSRLPVTWSDVTIDETMEG